MPGWLVILGSSGSVALITAIVHVGQTAGRLVAATKENTRAMGDMGKTMQWLSDLVSRHETQIAVLADREERKVSAIRSAQGRRGL